MTQALRSIARSPWQTAVIVVSPALGTGASAALGANPARIVFALVGSSLTPAAAGVAAGIGGAYVLTRITASIVFGSPPLELPLVAEIVAVMTLVVLVAIVGPARAALRVSPLIALRQ